jgi:hypothetical protein
MTTHRYGIWLMAGDSRLANLAYKTDCHKRLSFSKLKGWIYHSSVSNSFVYGQVMQFWFVV